MFIEEKINENVDETPHEFIRGKVNSETDLSNQPTSIIDRISKEIKHKKKKIKEANANIKIQSNKSKFLLLTYIFIYSLYLLSIKIIVYPKNQNSNEYPSLSIIVFFMGIFQIIFSLIFMKIDHIDITKTKNFNKNEIDELIFRALVEFINILFILLSLSNMRIVSSITIFLLSPIIRTFILLKQKMDQIKKFDKLCYAFLFVVCLIYLMQDFYIEEEKKENFIDNYIGTVYCMISAVTIALTSISEKKTCNDFHPYVIVFVSGLFGVSISPIWMNIQGVSFDVTPSDCTLFVFSAFCFFFMFYYNQKFVQMSFFLNKSGLNYITIVLGYGFSIFILDEPITLSDILASVISILVNFYSKIRLEISENEDDL